MDFLFVRVARVKTEDFSNADVFEHDGMCKDFKRTLTADRCRQGELRGGETTAYPVPLRDGPGMAARPIVKRFARLTHKSFETVRVCPWRPAVVSTGYVSLREASRRSRARAAFGLTAPVFDRFRARCASASPPGWLCVAATDTYVSRYADRPMSSVSGATARLLWTTEPKLLAPASWRQCVRLRTTGSIAMRLSGALLPSGVHERLTETPATPQGVASVAGERAVWHVSAFGVGIMAETSPRYAG